MSNLPRASAPPGTHAAPEVAMDSCFLVKDGGDMSVTALVIKDRESRAILAHPVLRKGRLRDDAVDQAVASIRRLGRHPRVLLKSGNEPATLDLRRAV
eukprot:7256697-Alexandrium_andersonii.AAC.1